MVNSFQKRTDFDFCASVVDMQCLVTHQNARGSYILLIVIEIDCL